MRMIITVLILLFVVFAFIPEVYSQDEQSDSSITVITMGQEEWHLKRDQYAVAAIILLRKLEKLDSAIAVLKKLDGENNKILPIDCDSELLVIVGASKEDYEDFRIKFTETEKKINSKIGTPDDARKMYFNEVTDSKIRCLPEFSDRYASLKKQLEPWENKKVDAKNPEGIYIVVKGDNLWRISEKFYNNPHLWTLIRDANEIITAKHLIYPGQILKIPSAREYQK